MCSLSLAPLVGYMFPGVVAGPSAPVKLGPDVVNGTTHAYSGYLEHGDITGFSIVGNYYAVTCCANC